DRGRARADGRALSDARQGAPRRAGRRPAPAARPEVAFARPSGVAQAGQRGLGFPLPASRESTTKERTMQRTLTEKDTYLQNFEREYQITLRVLQAYPPDKAD